MLCCPITSRVKGYPFEVALGEGQELAGVVLADQVKSLDWKARQASKKGRASSQVMTETLSKLQTLRAPIASPSIRNCLPVNPSEISSQEGQRGGSSQLASTWLNDFP
jgi:mRNA interferase MazF